MSLYMDVHTIAGESTRRTWPTRTRPTCRRRIATACSTCATGSARTRERSFCLVEAPSADAATAVHKEAHGLVADDVFLVAEGS